MTDRELLTLAAKAAGIDVSWVEISGNDWHVNECFVANEREWNPLTDDGDALRLAVKLNIDIAFGIHACQINAEIYDWVDESVCAEAAEKSNGDPYAATRRAITRAAAEIGKQMKEQGK